MFTITKPLRFGDCDPSGIAYCPSYLNILVGVLEDFFRLARFPLAGDERRALRISVPTVRLDLTFRQPRLSGRRTGFHARGAAPSAAPRSTWSIRFRARDTVLWTAKHRIVAVPRSTPMPQLAWPDDIRAALTQQLETPHAHHLAT
jgi:4-hydroxybenzoyl-CoA thioesterase